jgi:tetratricopeptide (TPR) repeat protein
VRRLVADAAVLGTTFPAEALIAVSGRDEAVVRAALAELVRREVFSVSADRLSPERGSYGFAQNMLRQVAYDTLSRRDRKARHLAVAAHLRAAFPGDGEEVTDVIARHYLDALGAVPDGTDVGQIRGQAIAALIRAGERADRTGAPKLAATSYATAAQLASADAGPGDGAAGRPGGADGPPDVGGLWERAAQAAAASADWAAALGHADRARDYYLHRGQARAAARAQAAGGRALQLWGRYAEARDQLTAALEVLRADPDADTVRALDELAWLGVYTGSPHTDRLTTEALTLSQYLDIAAGELSGLFITRGIYLLSVARRPEAIAYLRESVRLATQANDNLRLGRALLNLAAALAVGDPQAAADAARTAAGHLRRAGHRDYLAVAISNLADGLLMLGEWDAAEQESAKAIDADGLADSDLLTCDMSWLAALRGDTVTAETLLAKLGDLRVSDNPQDHALIALVRGFSAAARRQPRDALRHVRAILARVETLGMVQEYLCWAWPLAARSAYELGDTAAARELLTVLDDRQLGRLAGILRAERDLVRARLAAQGGDQAADESFAAAIGGLRELSTPYHLAHGLLDQAEYLTRLGDAAAAAAVAGEACDIAHRLRCQPLLDRAEDIVPATVRADA